MYIRRVPSEAPEGAMGPTEGAMGPTEGAMEPILVELFS